MAEEIDVSECDTVAELDEHLRLLVEINNNLVQSIKYLEQLNTQLCKMVSNLNNMMFICDKQCERINENLP